MRLEAGEAIKEDEEAAAVAMVGFDSGNYDGWIPMGNGVIGGQETLSPYIFPTGGQEVDGET